MGFPSVLASRRKLARLSGKTWLVPAWNLAAADEGWNNQGQRRGCHDGTSCDVCDPEHRISLASIPTFTMQVLAIWAWDLQTWQFSTAPRVLKVFTLTVPDDFLWQQVP